MSGLYRVKTAGDAVRFDDGTDLDRAIAIDTVGRLRSAAWAAKGIRADGHGRFSADAKVAPADKVAIQAVIRGDANAPQLRRGVQLLGEVNAIAQQMAYAPLVDALTARIVATCDASTAAKIVADASNAAGIRADASLLGSAAAIKENLTLWAYRVFRAPPEVLHYRDFFVMDDGLDPFNLQIQLLFSLRTGEAKLWDGSSGGNHAIGDRQFDELRLDVNGLIASKSIGYIDAGRMGIMGIDALADARGGLNDAIELAHNRLAFGGSSDGPKVLGLKNWPGLAVKATGYSLATATDAQILTAMNNAVRKPVERSNQKYQVKRLCVSTAIMTRLTAVTPTAAGTASILKMFMDANPGITVEEMHELNGLWGTGVHAMVGLPADPNVAPTYLRAPTVFLPEVNTGVATMVHAVSATAGIYCQSPVGVAVYTFTA